MKNLLPAAAACVQLLVGLGYGQSSDKKPQPSMMFSCETMPFLSASVSTPRRDRIPEVQIKLTDPLSRTQGANAGGKEIPRSQYENVVMIPALADHSKAHAVEICGAERGEYEVTVYEHGDAFYRLEVGADNSDFIAGNLHSREGRVRQYRFSFTVKKEQVHLTWLDKNDQPQINIGNNDW